MVPAGLAIVTFLACLASAPEQCRQVELVVEMPRHYCEAGLGAQTVAASWMQQHPGLTVREPRCRSGMAA